MEKTQVPRTFSGLLTIQSVPISDTELTAAGVPPEKWSNARIGYDVSFRGEANIVGVGGAIGAIIRCFMTDLPIPAGVPPELVRSMFVDNVLREAIATLGSGVQLPRGTA